MVKRCRRLCFFVVDCLLPVRFEALHTINDLRRRLRQRLVAALVPVHIACLSHVLQRRLDAFGRIPPIGARGNVCLGCRGFGFGESLLCGLNRQRKAAFTRPPAGVILLSVGLMQSVGKLGMLKARECLSVAILAIAVICCMPSGQTAAGAAGGAPAAPATVDKRLPVPTASQQAADKQTLERLFHQKYRAANAENLRQFANYLWNTYSSAQGRPVMHYVAMKTLGRLAGKLGMASLCYDAADALSQAYRVNQSQLYVQAGKILLAGRYFPAYVYQSVHDRSVTQEQQAFSAGDYKNAETLIRLAARAAMIVQNSLQVANAQAELRRVQSRLTLVRQAELDMAALKRKPNDRKLQLRVGLYLWLEKGQTEKGLGLIEASAFPGAAELAKLQTQGPPDLYAWVRYYHLLIQLGQEAKSPPYAALATRHATVMFANRTLTVVQHFYAYWATDYSHGKAFLNMAIGDAASSNIPSLRAMAVKWQQLANDAAALHKRFHTAMREVEARPKYPRANALVGEYLCLIKGQWKIGSDYLLRSGERKLIAATKLDAAARRAEDKLSAAGHGSGAARSLALAAAKQASRSAGDAWWSFATNCRGLLQVRSKARAVHWYRRAYKPVTRAPAAILYRIKRLEGQHGGL